MAGNDAPGSREETLGLAYQPEHGVWRGVLPERLIMVLVTGTAEGPDRDRLAAVRSVLERLDDLAAVLAAHLAETEIPLDGEGEAAAVLHPEPPTIAWVAVEASTPARPDLIAAAFRTGHPDTGHLYVAEVAGSAVEEVTATRL